MLEGRNIGKQYKKGSRIVLEEVDFSLHKQDFFVVTGASGSGKSTLLAIAGGYLKPTTGEVIFQGKNLYALRDKTLSALHNQTIGYVPQSNVLLKGYTVLENVLAPYFLGTGKDSDEKRNQVKERALELLEALQIKNLSQSYGYELSGGEQKRVSLARALLGEPELLIADEPTTGLDKDTAILIADYLDAYVKKGKTVFVATHDELVMGYGNRGLQLNNGRIVGQ